PVPFGQDLYMQLGTSFSIPILGNFDPPVTTAGVVDLTEEEVVDVLNRMDVSGDGYVTPLDALLIINELNANGSHTALTGVERLMDVNADTAIAPSDVLAIFNYLNENHFIQAEGEGASSFTVLTTDATSDAPITDAGDVLEVADGQFLAAANSMRIVFAPNAAASGQLEELFATLDRGTGRADRDEAASIDSLLSAFESDELFSRDSTIDTRLGSVIDELLSDEELFDMDELATDVLQAYDRGNDQG
ncbi:MAG: hypothetical protein WD070_00830, partial [Pirellulaceae bacterium]